MNNWIVKFSVEGEAITSAWEFESNLVQIYNSWDEACEVMIVYYPRKGD